jgi:hypothetical protein
MAIAQTAAAVAALVAVAAHADTPSAEELKQSIQERSQKIAEYRKLLDDSDQSVRVAACKHKPSGSPTAFDLGSRSLTIESPSGSCSVTMGSRSLTGARQQTVRLTLAANEILQQE